MLILLLTPNLCVVVVLLGGPLVQVAPEAPRWLSRMTGIWAMDFLQTVTVDHTSRVLTMTSVNDFMKNRVEVCFPLPPPNLPSCFAKFRLMPAHLSARGFNPNAFQAALICPEDAAVLTSLPRLCSDSIRFVDEVQR